ncbi:hypothetical protein AGR7A_pAt20103 [Agrobacterium deltaense NCPPB 1641]|uniref:Uncharacterized protein n=1 Tax=Agrobacterium deltaense NCPPB 1641 TaxID=1183425 RepID=A0A1S7U952_9HYPH|nr:hypothetical protein AGR7A_pAt20103 [Agrobacterium deltaense NCPPB 1641]
MVKAAPMVVNRWPENQRGAFPGPKTRAATDLALVDPVTCFPARAEIKASSRQHNALLLTSIGAA